MVMLKPVDFLKKRSFVYSIMLIVSINIIGMSHARAFTDKQLKPGPVFNDTISSLRVTLGNTWKFKAADDSRFILPQVDVSTWNSIVSSTSWEKQGHATYGYSWYRNIIRIPSRLKGLVTREGFLFLHLGKIGEADMTYFNGKFLGQSGNFPPDFKSASNQQRAYPIKASAILWDQDNVIAIRVYADKPGNSGLFEGKCFLSPFVFTDFVSFHLENARTDQGLLTLLSYSNNSDRPVSGIFLYSVYNSQNQLVSQDTGHAILVTGQNREFSFKAPLETNDIFFTNYTFIDDLRSTSLNSDGYISNLGVINLPVKETEALKVDFQQKNEFISTPFSSQKLTGVIGQRLNNLFVQGLLTVDDKKLMNAYFNRNSPGREDLIEAATLLDIGSSVWKYNKDLALKAQLDRIIHTIILTQNKQGILYALPRNDTDKLTNNSDVYPATFNSVLTYYQATGYRPALDCGIRFGNMIITSIDSVINRQTSIGEVNLKDNYSGFLIPLLNLYQITGKEQYLNYGKLIAGLYSVAESRTEFISREIISDTVGRELKILRQLQNLTGLIMLSRITNDNRFAKYANSVWSTLIKSNEFSKEVLYSQISISGLLVKTRLSRSNLLSAWIRYNEQLFQNSGEMRFYNEIEKQLYSIPFTADIGAALSPEFLVGTIDQKPVLLGYESGIYDEHINTANGTSIRLSIQCMSNYPNGDDVRIILTPEKEVSFTLMLRVPAWCLNFKAMIGTKTYSSLGNDFLSIQRLWKPGDHINIHYDLPAPSQRPGQLTTNGISKN